MNDYVLVLDDDESVRELLELILTDEGYQVRSASTSGEALELVRQKQPRLILFDLTLRSERGEDFISAYRQTEGASARLVVTSGVDDLQQRATDIGADAYLLKPWELDELLEIVQGIFTREAA